MFVAGLVDCDYYSVFENVYSKFEPLANVKDSQPDGFIARFPVYALGARDAHILLTTSDAPLLTRDWAYEFCETTNLF